MRTDEELRQAFYAAPDGWSVSVRALYNLGRKDVVDETSGELARMHADLAAERARHRSTAAALSDATTLAEERLAHANALQADIEAEQEGRIAIRRRFGARDSESMVAFVERLVVERETAVDDAALARRERDAEAAERIAANAALAAEKAAHERKRGELATETEKAKRAEMLLESEREDHLKARLSLVATRNELAACEERIRGAVLYARDRSEQPWARRVLAALGQPAAEREGEAQKTPETDACACGCGERESAWRYPGDTAPLTPDDVRRLAREVVAEAAERAGADDVHGCGSQRFKAFVGALRRGTP